MPRPAKKEADPVDPGPQVKCKVLIGVTGSCEGVDISSVGSVVDMPDVSGTWDMIEKGYLEEVGANGEGLAAPVDEAAEALEAGGGDPGPAPESDSVAAAEPEPVVESEPVVEQPELVGTEAAPAE